MPTSVDFADVLKDRPTVSIPDDHDVGQPNPWGQNGKVSKAPGATDGGYAMPAGYVREVERAQTAHLPDPFDPTLIEQDIGVYYTAMNWGRIRLQRRASVHALENPGVWGNLSFVASCEQGSPIRHNPETLRNNWKISSIKQAAKYDETVGKST